MTDNPFVFSLLRYSGHDLVQLMSKHETLDGLQCAIFSFPPPWRILYHVMSSTSFSEHFSWIARLRSILFPTVVDKPWEEKPKRDWLIILQILNVNLKVTSRLHLAEKFWKKSKSTLQLGQSSKLTWINDSPQRKLIKDVVWQGCPSELTIYPYPLWDIFSVKPRVHNNLRILQENPFIISWVLWLRFKKTPNFLHGITMLQYSLCQNTSPPIQIQAISRWVPSDGGIRNCDPHITLYPLNISAAP